MKLQDIGFNSKGTIVIDLHETVKAKITNCDMNGQGGSFYACWTKHLEAFINSSTCPKKCMPMMLKINFALHFSSESQIPDCDLSDERCIGTEAETKFFGHNCKGSCSTKEYTGKTLTISQGTTDFNETIGPKVDLLFHSTVRSRTLIKEYKVYDTAGLIGTLGGSLGLFLGVSFFGVVSDVLDWFWMKFQNLNS